MMKIEHGKFYETRGGRTVGPVVRTNDTVWPFWIPSENYRSYREDGITTSPSGWIESEHDLIKLKTDN